MAITYLSGQRVQGLSPPSTATFDGKSENDQTDTWNDDIRGEQIQTGHALMGKVITSITLKAKRGGTSGTFKIGLFNATGVLQHEFKSASISTLSTSYAEVTGNDLGSGDTTADRTVGTNYIIGMTNSGNTSNRVEIRQSTSAGRANEVAGKCASAGSSFVEDGAGNKDIYFEATYAIAGDTKPTDVPTGSQFEETDTRKFYQFKKGVTTDEPYFHFKFDEASGDAVNSGSFGSTGNLTVSGLARNQSTPSGLDNGMSNTSGSSDYAYNGAGDYAYKFMHDGSKWSASFWAKLTADSLNEKYFFSNEWTDDQDQGFFIRTKDDSSSTHCKMRVSISNGTALVLDVTTPSQMIPDLDWHFYCITVDPDESAGDVMIISRDAEESGTGYYKSGTVSGSFSSSNPVRKTSFFARDGGNNVLAGTMAQVMLWDGKILTQAEKEALYASGNGTTSIISAWKERGTAI